MADSSLCHLALAKLDAADLAARGFGELADELDLAGILVRGGLRLAEVLYLAGEPVARFVVLADDDVRLDDAAAVLVRGRDHRALDDRGVLYEDALDLEGTDAVSGGEDHVVRAALEPQVTVLVPVGPVPREIVAASEDRFCLVGLLPVLLEEARDPVREGYVARLVRPALVALRVHDLHFAAGGGLAHRTGAYLEAGEVADDQGVLRLAVAVVDRDAVQLFPPLYDRRVQRLPGRDRVPEPREVSVLQLGGLREQAVLGRGLAEDGDLVPLHEVEPFGLVEATLVEEDLASEAPRPQEDVPDALRPAGPRSAPQPVTLLQIQPVPRLHPLRVGVAVGVQHALGVLGGPRGIEDERPIIGRGVF